MDRKITTIISQLLVSALPIMLEKASGSRQDCQFNIHWHLCSDELALQKLQLLIKISNFMSRQWAVMNYFHYFCLMQVIVLFIKHVMHNFRKIPSVKKDIRSRCQIMQECLPRLHDLEIGTFSSNDDKLLQICDKTAILPADMLVRFFPYRKRHVVHK